MRPEPRNILTKHDIRRLVARLTSSYEGRKLKWKTLGQECGLDCSGDTIRRALNALGYHRSKACRKPFISQKAQSDRRKYSAEHNDKPISFWRIQMYADECSFSTADHGTKRVTRLPTERYHLDCLQWSYQSGRASIMIWGAISYNWKSQLIFLDKTTKDTGKVHKNGKLVTRTSIGPVDYRDQVLIPVVAPAFKGKKGYKGYKKGGKYVEDNAGVHGNKGVLIQCKKDLRIPVQWRPSYSPDLNPIENVWRTMKMRIRRRARPPKTVTELREAIQEEWDKLVPEDWNKYIDEMPERIAQCKARKGLATQF
ncbi:hypothetical protein BJ508DRAFT_218412 [Ascobolus immersus RN42]|uniref:Tc1-like transposase DDE domain-containing protein n=1 Tax=Ascobolus immersus RN42 TaxID=1160509 RepID=A0A3N4HDM0_ASCIM|nr:hypothetical protein BJ508DRAFT_218412 [Ascobolus immersus RN42]